MPKLRAGYAEQIPGSDNAIYQISQMVVQPALVTFINLVENINICELSFLYLMWSGHKSV